jgi:hypothetical protein
VADRGEDNIGGITRAILEMAAAQVSVGLHVADHGFDGGSSPEFAFDDAEDTALLSQNEDAPRVGRVVAAAALVDITAFDRAPSPYIRRSSRTTK